MFRYSYLQMANLASSVMFTLIEYQQLDLMPAPAQKAFTLLRGLNLLDQWQKGRPTEFPELPGLSPHLSPHLFLLSLLSQPTPEPLMETEEAKRVEKTVESVIKTLLDKSQREKDGSLKLNASAKRTRTKMTKDLEAAVDVFQTIMSKALDLNSPFRGPIFGRCLFAT